MRPLQIFSQICLLIYLTPFVYAESPCFNSLNRLKDKTNTVNFNGGIWGYFEKTPQLKEMSSSAIQLDSGINKIFFALNHLCLTEKGVPLNELATYISHNLSIKSKSEFKAELLSIGKTPKQIDVWFKFYLYAQSRKSRILIFSKIKNAIDQSFPIITTYIQLANEIIRGAPSEEILKNTLSLNVRINQILSKQPYLILAIEEISHVPFWDINESTGGS